jgi:hypothetical protein
MAGWVDHSLQRGVGRAEGFCDRLGLRPLVVYARRWRTTSRPVKNGYRPTALQRNAPRKRAGQLSKISLSRAAALMLGEFFCML